MKKILCCAAVLSSAACGGTDPSTTQATGLGETESALRGSVPAFASIPVCPGPAVDGDARCHSHVRSDERGVPLAATGPSGYGPKDLQVAYGLPSSSAGGGQTFAIVDAYDDPNAEADLNTYRSTFGLSACTTANGCFRKVNQDGGTRLPRGNQGWALEISLDLAMASAICPNCKILLVEASSATLANLTAEASTRARRPTS